MMEEGIFPRFLSYEFDEDDNFQAGLSIMKQQIDGQSSTSWLQKAKVFYYNKFVEPISLEAFLKWKAETYNYEKEPITESEDNVAELGECLTDCNITTSSHIERDAGDVLDAGEVLDAGAVLDAGEVLDAGAVLDAGEVLDAGAVLDAVLDAGLVLSKDSTYNGLPTVNMAKPVLQNSCLLDNESNFVNTDYKLMHKITVESEDSMNDVDPDLCAIDNISVKTKTDVHNDTTVSGDEQNECNLEISVAVLTDPDSPVLNEDTENSQESALHLLDKLDSAEESLSFTQIMDYIQKGEQIPGIRDLDIQPTNMSPTQSDSLRKTKPWEHADIESSIVDQ